MDERDDNAAAGLMLQAAGLKAWTDSRRVERRALGYTRAWKCCRVAGAARMAGANFNRNWPNG